MDPAFHKHVKFISIHNTFLHLTTAVVIVLKHRVVNVESQSKIASTGDGRRITLL